MRPIPVGWHEATIAAIAEVILGQAPPGASYNHAGSGLPLYQGKTEFEALYIGPPRLWTTSPNKIAEPEDVLLCVRAPVGPVNLARERCAIGRGLAAIRAGTDVLPRYLLYWLMISESDPVIRATGTTFAAIPGRVVREHRIPIAPAAQQARIVTAIELAFGELDTADSRLRDANRRSRVMLAAVAQDAITGRQSRVAGRQLSGEQPAIPSAWMWVRLGDVAQVQGGITKNPERRPRRNTAPFLRVANVGRDRLDLSDLHRVEIKNGEDARYGLRYGDLLVVEGNGSADQIGRSAMWRCEVPNAVHQNHLIRVRPGPRLMPEYLALYWNAPWPAQQIAAAASSTSGLHTLSTGKVANIPIALPPLADQMRLVAHVSTEGARLGDLRKSISTAQARSRSLRRSVLNAAFSGRLVP